MTLRQVSAGGVVFKSVKSHIRVCLIARRANGRQVWCLPKGHVERGEALEEAALREIREETGVTGSSCLPLQAISYSFFDMERGSKIFKKVHFFLVRRLKGNLAHHDEEAECVKWFPIDQAVERAEYPSERSVLRKAKRCLKEFGW